jgi:hypothetical protein
MYSLTLTSTQCRYQCIFECTKEDEKPWLSIEDRAYLDIMNREFTYLGSKGKLVAPIKKLREPIPGNHPVALRCAKS